MNESHDTITDKTLIKENGEFEKHNAQFLRGFCQKQEEEENRSPYGLYNFINQLPFKIIENLKYSVISLQI